MKFCLFFLLLFCSSAAYADDRNEPGADNDEPKKGDTIWLEEKINPTTTWIESLVKPLTEWMEGQIQEPESETDSQDASSSQTQEPEILINESISDQGSEFSDKTHSKISEEQAREFAIKHVAGDVLYIKFVSKTNLYRVKLITKQGEVRIVYIKAVSGEPVSSNGEKLKKHNSQKSKEEGDEPDSIPLYEDLKREGS